MAPALGERAQCAADNMVRGMETVRRDRSVHGQRPISTSGTNAILYRRTCNVDLWCFEVHVEREVEGVWKQHSVDHEPEARGFIDCHIKHLE